MASQAARGSRQGGRSARPAAAATSASATKSVYRLLVMRGMSSTEAASLTALMCGLPSSDLHWSLDQLNHLLFLRRMHETGRY